MLLFVPMLLQIPKCIITASSGSSKSGEHCSRCQLELQHAQQEQESFELSTVLVANII